MQLASLGITRYTPQQFEYMADNFRLATFAVESPYVLLPCVTACVEVRMTVSQVTAWPRTVALGQCSMALKENLFATRVASWNQGLRSTLWSLLPQPGDDAKKILVTVDAPLAVLPTAVSMATALLGTGANRDTWKIAKRVATDKADYAMELFGGVLTWSLLTMSNEAQNHAGYLYSLPRGTGGERSAAKREVWSVLVDAVLYNFASTDALKPKIVADLRQCRVVPLGNDVFRIDNINKRSDDFAFKNLFFMGKTKKEGAEWFFKIYSQSASNVTHRYASLNFRAGDAACFSMARDDHHRDDDARGRYKNASTSSSSSAAAAASKERDVRISPALQAYRADPMLQFLFEAPRRGVAISAAGAEENTYVDDDNDVDVDDGVSPEELRRSASRGSEGTGGNVVAEAAAAGLEEEDSMDAIAVAAAAAVAAVAAMDAAGPATSETAAAGGDGEGTADGLPALLVDLAEASLDTPLASPPPPSAGKSPHRRRSLLHTIQKDVGLGNIVRTDRKSSSMLTSRKGSFRAMSGKGGGPGEDDEEEDDEDDEDDEAEAREARRHETEELLAAARAIEAKQLAEIGDPTKPPAVATGTGVSRSRLRRFVRSSAKKG